MFIQRNGCQPIHVAAGIGCIAIVKKLVEEYGVPVEPVTLVKISCIISNE